MNITKSIYISSVGSENEGIYAYHYNISITFDLNTSTLVALFKSVDLFYEKSMSDY